MLHSNLYIEKIIMILRNAKAMHTLRSTSKVVLYVIIHFYQW